jgi:hypothetical protein
MCVLGDTLTLLQASMQRLRRDKNIRSNFVAIIAGIDVCNVWSHSRIGVVHQIFRWHPRRVWITSPVLLPQGHTNRAGKGFLYSATWKLYDRHLAFSENAALTGRVRAGFLEKSLDRKVRQAGPSRKPKKSHAAISTGIHPRCFAPALESRAAK